MSILSISSIAFITLCGLAALLSPISLPNALGMICHDRPYLSFSHPQRSFFPRPTTSPTARRPLVDLLLRFAVHGQQLSRQREYFLAELRRRISVRYNGRAEMSGNQAIQTSH